MSQATPNSLRLRLLAGSAIAVFVAMVLAGFFIGNLYRLHTTERFKTELDHHLTELAGMIEVAGSPIVTQPLSDPQFNVPGSGLYWQVEGAGGILLRSPSLGGRSLDTMGFDQWIQARVGSEPLLQRSMAVRKGGRSLRVTIASARDLLDAQIRHFQMDLTLSMAAVGLLLLAGAVLLVWFGLAPVRRLGEEVDRLRHGEIERLDPQVPAEFVPVVERLNGLLDGQARLIARARTESGNLAHNVRTPLALIMDEAEQLRLVGQEQAAELILSRCAIMQRQIDYHLSRAVAAGTRGAGTVTEVAPLLAQIIEAMRRLHAERMLTLRAEIPEGFRLPCDRGDLAEIVSNLVDNACKWARSAVIVTSGPDFLEVRDDGVGIPADKRDQVLTVGTRLDFDTPGTGLGLPAVVDLLHFYDGRLLLDTAAEGGLSAKIVFR
jgi:signal transduction histidine kinase